MTGRPAKSEAAEYYFTYIDQVPGDDPLAAMRDQLQAQPASATSSPSTATPAKGSLRFHQPRATH